MISSHAKRQALAVKLGVGWSLLYYPPLHRPPGVGWKIPFDKPPRPVFLARVFDMNTSLKNTMSRSTRCVQSMIAWCHGLARPGDVEELF